MKELCKDNLSNELRVQGIYCISINNKKYVGSSVPVKNYKTVKILQLDQFKHVIKKWDSLTEAQNELKISNISRALRKGTKAGTFYWKYE